MSCQTPLTSFETFNWAEIPGLKKLGKDYEGSPSSIMIFTGKTSSHIPSHGSPCQHVNLLLENTAHLQPVLANGVFPGVRVPAWTDDFDDLGVVGMQWAQIVCEEGCRKLPRQSLSCRSLQGRFRATLPHRMDIIYSIGLLSKHFHNQNVSDMKETKI